MILIYLLYLFFFVGEECYNYQISGHCIRGLTCRYARDHTTQNNRTKIDAEKSKAYQALGPYTVNQLTYELQTALRKRKYDFSESEKLIKYNDNIKKLEASAKVYSSIM